MGMKKIKIYCVGILLTAIFCVIGATMGAAQVYAQEEAVVTFNQVMSAKEDVAVKETPDEQAATVHSYACGDAVLVIGEEQDGWYPVQFGEGTGYVPTESLTELDIDIEGLNEEFKREEEEGKLVVEFVERKRAEIKRARIWGTVIAVLVIGIFGMGIYSTVKANRVEDKEETAAQTQETDDSVEQESKRPAEEVQIETEVEEMAGNEVPDEIIDLDQE